MAAVVVELFSENFEFETFDSTDGGQSLPTYKTK
jgi:hypothetical protein